MKKILCLMFASTLTTTSVATPIAIAVNKNSANFDLKSFNEIEVKNNDFIKGVDVSSYAEVLEGYLFQNNIFKSESDSSVTQYTYKDFGDAYKYDAGKTIQEHLDESVFSYIDSYGNRKYDNMFSILKSEGVNSIRLRLWVDPTDENGNSYGGGHNDIDTDIYIIKDAIKHGIDNFVIDFQFSDFWADPEREFYPKSWEGQKMDELKDTINNYTYNSIKKIYNETGGYLPYSVQIGNEITKGCLWKEGKLKNYDESIQYVISGAKGVLKAQNELVGLNKRYNKNYEIKKILHIESPGTDNYYEALNNYMGNDELRSLIDVVGITYYPFWQGTPDKMFNLVKELKFNYPDKQIQIMEFSLTYTNWDSGNTGDSPSIGSSDYYSKLLPNNSPEDQIVMLYDYFLALSRALPNDPIAIYWWEPAWLNVGNTTWATREGIDYSFNGNESKIKVINL